MPNATASERDAAEAPTRESEDRHRTHPPTHPPTHPRLCPTAHRRRRRRRRPQMVNVPKERKTFCKGKKCKKHTVHKVGPRSSPRQGRCSPPPAMTSPLTNRPPAPVPHARR